MLGASPLQMGILAAVGVAPSLIFGLWAGVWADRMKRRPVLVLTNIVRAVSLASIPAAFALDALRIEQLYVVAFVNGACRTFFEVSFGAYLPTLVGRGNLTEANGKLEAIEEPLSPQREVWDGIVFVLRHPMLRAVTGSGVAEGLLHGIVGAVVLIYGVRELGFGTGILATIFAVGVSPRLSVRRTLAGSPDTLDSARR